MQDVHSLNLSAARGVAVREFGLKPGHGTADYLLYVDQKAAGIIEAKPAGHILTGVETQSGKYSDGPPDTLPAHRKPLPFLYATTGAETRFTNLLDPEPRSRGVFAFHTPGALADWVGSHPTGGLTSTASVAEPSAAYWVATNLRHRLTEMPRLDAGALWPVQARAIGNLEGSLALARVPYDHTETVDKGHGRVERRECWVITDPDYLDYLDPQGQWPQLKAAVRMVGRHQTSIGATSQPRYYISSLAGSAEQLLAAIRVHWSIENSLHWTLDLSFREDQCRMRKDHGPQNINTLRQIGRNLLKTRPH